jgi:hypothetical protein
VAAAAAAVAALDESESRQQLVTAVPAKPIRPTAKANQESRQGKTFQVTILKPFYFGILRIFVIS